MIAPAPMPKPPADTRSPSDGAPARGLVAAIRPLDPAAPWVAAWEALVPAPRPRRQPVLRGSYALAAAPAFGAGVRMLLVADRPPEEPGARLLAAWPHRRVARRWGLPLPVLMAGPTATRPSASPSSTETIPPPPSAALLAAPQALGEPPRLLLQNAPADGPFRALLDDAGPAGRLLGA